MNQPACIHRTTCRLCESPNVELVMPIAASPVADDYPTAAQLDQRQDAYPLDLYLCRACGHAQILDVVNPDILFRNYTYVTSVSLGLVEHFRKYADEVTAALRPAPGSLVVEIGSNDGSLLRFFKDKGLRVLGVDPARDIAAKATASGVETVPDFFSSALGRKLRAERGPAQLMCANNVFAHGDGLGDMCDGIRELLAPDGVFVFEVAYLVDLVDRDLFDTVYHEHLCYHSVKPLAEFFRRHGMELFDVQHIASKGGSIRGFAQPAGGPRPVTAAVGAMIANEVQRGFDQPPVFQAFSRKIDAARDAMIKLLGELKGQGKVIAGYGASATCTTLLHHFELGPFLTFVVDDNAVKQGRFTPGAHIPVFHPKALLERKPDYTVVLAWQYQEPIIKKNQAYRDAGGRFIVPFPKLTIT